MDYRIGVLFDREAEEIFIRAKEFVEKVMKVIENIVKEKF